MLNTVVLHLVMTENVESDFDSSQLIWNGSRRPRVSGEGAGNGREGGASGERDEW